MTDVLKKGPSPEKHFSHEIVGSPVVDFESYRLLCDVIDEFRKVGIQDADAFEAALRDERTVYVEYGGLRLPILTPIKYEKMYNEERCLAMSGKEKAMLLALPLQSLEQMNIEDQFRIGEDTVVIVEEFVPVDKEVRMDQHDTSGLPFVDVAAIDFKNPALATKPQHETAWMAAYTFEAEPRRNTLKSHNGGMVVDDMMQAWHERSIETGQPEFPEGEATGTFILSAAQLKDRPDIVRQLWEISQIGFGKILGESHPVSMEFNQEFFLRQIVAKNAITSVHYVDGIIECFGFVGFDMRNNGWINEESTATREFENDASARQRVIIHFHELIGRGKRGMGYATKVLKSVFETIAGAGYAYSVFFESTNLSSTYIPSIIKRDLEKSDIMAMTSEFKTIGKLAYWGLVSQSDAERAHGYEEA